ncbi:hypothetical protein [Neobacillus niacini]|uniref:hypothetical protein n=1 Tax=Neobacillus niacini TaxID=86668 RepID=UPI0021CB0A9A|nr:hypothetical protein [Neobacillus niacini]MCM3763946.1 hypothetical protein [Neobacillus niacini]
MESKGNNITRTSVEFSEIVKKAYEKGLTEDKLTIDQLMADLKAELKHLVAGC